MSSFCYNKIMSRNKPYITILLKMVVALSIFTGVIGAIFLLSFLPVFKSPKITIKPTPILSPTTAPSPTPQSLICGGIAGKQCPTGYFCKLSSNKPDASGECIKQDSIKNQTICTMEAKQCPDGSWVGRQGPKCEFAPCPKPL